MVLHDSTRVNFIYGQVRELAEEFKEFKTLIAISAGPEDLLAYTARCARHEV